VADLDCTFDERAGYVVGAMRFQNKYMATLTINAGLILETANGFVLNSATPQAEAKILFVDILSTLRADAGASNLYYFDFTGQEGTVDIRTNATKLVR
jgi:hypothetical protein